MEEKKFYFLYLKGKEMTKQTGILLGLKASPELPAARASWTAARVQYVFTCCLTTDNSGVHP